MSFEWLSEVPFFLIYRAAGLQGIVILYSVLLILIFTGVYYRSWRNGADSKDAALATLAGICIGLVSFYPRTVLFGWICMTVLLLVLDRFQRTGKACGPCHRYLLFGSICMARGFSEYLC